MRITLSAGRGRQDNRYWGWPQSHDSLQISAPSQLWSDCKKTTLKSICQKVLNIFWLWLGTTEWERQSLQSDAARCQGDPFQLCLKTQTPRAKERERRREKSSWSYFFPPNKIGRLFFTLIHASSLRSPWCCGNCSTEARPTNSTRQLVPVIGTGIFVSVGDLHLYQAAHGRKLQAAVYFKCNGTWQAQKCSAKMPVQCIHCDWNTVLSHQRVEFVSHSKKGWSQNKIPTVTRKTNAGWAVAALQLNAKKGEEADLKHALLEPVTITQKLKGIL